MAKDPKYKYEGRLVAEADKEKGELFDIIAAVTENGQCPFVDEFYSGLCQRYIESLRNEKGLEKEDRINYEKLMFYFEKFVATGKWNNIRQLRPIEDGFFEFKSIETGMRVIFYYDDQNRSVIILTHYFDKGGHDKTPPKEKKRMNDIRKSFDTRRRKGGN